jgi:sulfur-carrier protein adenylyltransferase/sulfurtransferase
MEGLFFKFSKQILIKVMNPQISVQVNEINVRQLQNFMKGSEAFQLIDVREPFERGIASLGGDLIPLDLLPDQIDKISRQIPVVIYCRTGRRSADAAFILQQVYGFTNVFNLKGGIHAWADEIDHSIIKY